ncbi:MAG: hypothetical protein AB8B58_11505 [Roseobacter sp.]
MSEAVANTEVESVLTSIRRLVREGRIVSPHAPKKAPDAFVLTPLHRVDNRNVYQLRPELAVSPPQIAQEQASPEPAKAEHDRPRTPLGVQELVAKIAALETVIADTIDQWEPDDTGASSYAGTRAPTLVLPESVTLDGTGKPVVEDDKAVANTDSDQRFDEIVVDEDVLRLLVTEVVRAELQGDTGDRISRNIRKLIRQEVKRALATEDIV